MDPSADNVPADDVPDLSGGRMILSVVGTVVVFRLVHAYTDTLGTAITAGDAAGRRADRARVRHPPT